LSDEVSTGSDSDPVSSALLKRSFLVPPPLSSKGYVDPDVMRLFDEYVFSNVNGLVPPNKARHREFSW